jgi:hypothetical protein
VQKPLTALLALLPLVCACQQRQAVETPTARCLPGDRGYLSMRLRGAIDADIDVRGADLGCEGGARPDGQGLRVSFQVPRAGPRPALRVVFGVDAAPRRDAPGPLPTNVTVIVEGQQRVYATQGTQHCSTEGVSQQAIGQAGEYRVAARGSCIDPAATLDGGERLYVDRFDFAGLAIFAVEAGNAAMHS